jgi:putative addiction module component (TIGR02574 family)
MEANELLKHALTLSEKERAELASNLIDSLDPTVDADSELVWQEEISRRLEDIERARVKTATWDEVRRKGSAIMNGQ